MCIIYYLSLHGIIIEGENLRIKLTKNNKTENLCWRYLYLNYKEMYQKNVFSFCIYIEV